MRHARASTILNSTDLNSGLDNFNFIHDLAARGEWVSFFEQESRGFELPGHRSVSDSGLHTKDGVHVLPERYHETGPRMRRERRGCTVVTAPGSRAQVASSSRLRPFCRTRSPPTFDLPRKTSSLRTDRVSLPLLCATER